jgi:NAD(P)-dependent dehydrogenase (short-subunit alcohol dehydrogenase family)
VQSAPPTADSFDADLSDKVAIVTGASRGIGRAIASRYARASARVVLASRTQEDLDAVAAEIEDDGGHALPVATHTGDPEAVASLVETVTDEYGGVDILVNNAATNPHFGPLLTAEESHFDKTFEVNIKGYFHLAKACAPLMKERGGGKIVNVASVAGQKPQPGMGVYSISKAGVLMLTEVLALELADWDIQVNAMVPGFVKTKFSRALWDNDELHEGILRMTPQRRLAKPEELTGLALMLASGASSFVTGAAIRVDGGLLLGPPLGKE